MHIAVRPLPSELAEKAKIELFEDPKKLEDSIEHLKEWVAKQPHLKARTGKVVLQKEFIKKFSL